MQKIKYSVAIILANVLMGCAIPQPVTVVNPFIPCDIIDITSPTPAGFLAAYEAQRAATERCNDVNITNK